MYDVVIIGAGITGASTFYTLSKYSSVKKVALVEQYHEPGSVTSKRTSNSQTLHFGDIETNYTAEKAKTVRDAAERMKQYVEAHKDEDLFYKGHKMVLAVGEEEVAALRERTKTFKKLFPKNRLIEREEIVKIEPNLVRGRDANTPLLAYYSDDGYAMDYGRIAQSMVRHATKKNYDVFLDNPVLKIIRKKNHYVVRTLVREIKTKTLMVAAGNYSLSLAQSLGYGKDLLVLPVGGNFYVAPKCTNGKVYMMQDPKLPFAAIHADPEVHDNDMTRFGPVVEMVPMLEKSFKGMWAFFKQLNIKGMLTIMKITFNWKYFRFILEQFGYKVPILGSHLYMKQIRKIVPSAEAKYVRLVKEYGGLRPQVLDIKKMGMNMGEAKVHGWNSIFDITPSPGASTALKNGEENTRELVKMLDERFFDAKLKKDYLKK